MNLATLYKKTSKDGVQQWTISVETIDDIPTIVSTYGLVDGKQQYSYLPVKVGKNIGKKNETTPREQAEAEALSMWRKKKDKGYAEDPDELVLAKQMSLKPMLAHNFPDYKHVVKYPCFIQPKLDGMRAVAQRVGNSIVWTSRGNKPIENVGHIENDLLKVMKDGDIFDGELYCHGVKLQTLISWIKRKQDDTVKVEYNVYDAMLNEGYAVRHNYIKSAITAVEKVKLVKTYEVKDAAELHKLYGQLVDSGYEGGIVRWGDFPYVSGYKDKQLLKLKSFVDEEYEILDVLEGKGKAAGLAATFECQTAAGKKFYPTTMGDEGQRREYLKNKKDIIGKNVTVEYFDLTDDNVPRFPKAKCIRDYE